MAKFRWILNLGIKMATISVSFGDSGTNYTELQDFLDDYNSGTIVTESAASHTIAGTDDIVCSIQGVCSTGSLNETPIPRELHG